MTGQSRTPCSELEDEYEATARQQYNTNYQATQPYTPGASPYYAQAPTAAPGYQPYQQASTYGSTYGQAQVGSGYATNTGYNSYPYTTAAWTSSTPSSDSYYATSTTQAGSSAYPSSEDPKPHKCTQCTASFYDKKDLARHDKIHSGERSHMCPYPDCEYYQAGFPRWDQLKRHLMSKTKHGLTAEQAEPYHRQ